MFILYFLVWTLLLYFIHRVAHGFEWASHMDHHNYIYSNSGTSWKWNNLLLYNDTWLSTKDLWITEVIPTILFCAITNQWWIAFFYYLWAALIQERIEHNSKFNIYPFLTSGKWHLIHHKDDEKNFGLFHPLWDMFFDTHEKIL